MSIDYDPFGWWDPSGSDMPEDTDACCETPTIAVDDEGRAYCESCDSDVTLRK